MTRPLSSTSKKPETQEAANTNVLEMVGQRWAHNDTLIIFGMKQVAFKLKEKESKSIILFALANSLGVKRFPRLTMACGFLSQEFEVSCLRSVAVTHE